MTHTTGGEQKEQITAEYEKKKRRMQWLSPGANFRHAETTTYKSKARLPANTELAVQRIFFFVKEETKTKK